MTTSNDRLSSGVAIDIDRAVIDPDYRRRILEQLRRDRLSAEAALRASIAAFLGFLAEEPAFARAFYVDMPAAGPRAVRRLEAAGHSFARMTHAWHERARWENPSWPAVPYEAYFALSGATAELVRAEVRHGKIGDIPALEDTLVALHLAVLAARPWHDGQPSAVASPLPRASRAWRLPVALSAAPRPLIIACQPGPAASSRLPRVPRSPGPGGAAAAPRPGTPARTPPGPGSRSRRAPGYRGPRPR